jgi:hypothetical protein
MKTKFYLKESSTDKDSSYIKQIYIKHKHWNPPPAPSTVGEKLTEFDKSLQKALKNLKTTKPT